MAHWNAPESGILRKRRKDNDIEKLLVFGYACKLFKDDEKALHIDQGKHLIPWMGDERLKIDRYDCRGHLSELSQYEASHEDYDTARWLGLDENERKLEQLCDEERYYSLVNNEEEEEMYKEEEQKRNKTNEFQYSYDVPTNPDEEQKVATVPEYDIEQKYEPSPDLDVPVDIEIPKTVREYTRIEKTAIFVSTQGPQMEILIKAKQSDNPQFSFLNQNDPLYKFYRHVLDAVRNRRYRSNIPKAGNIGDSCLWNRAFIKQFIELYKSFPCLWKIKSREYKNRDLKTVAYNKLVDFCKTINPEANKDYVVKKIQSFRGSFRKEMKKIEDSKQSGVGTDGIHIPRLWYFDLLLFTLDQELPNPSMFKIEEPEFEEGTSQGEFWEGTEDEDDLEEMNMGDCPYWSRDFIAQFIDLYRSFPCLWKIKSREYKNRNLKNVAYDKLVGFCKMINPEANKDYVVKKIQSLRGAFRKELKKIEDSALSGDSPHGIHIPKLWYFDLLLFTLDQDLPTQSVFKTEKPEIEEGSSQREFREDTEDEDDSEGMNHEQISARSSESDQMSTKHAVSKKRSRTTITNKTLDNSINYCNSQSENNDLLDEYDAAAISWAKKLKRMNPVQAIYADMFINKIVNLGLLNQLNTNSPDLRETSNSSLPAQLPSACFAKVQLPDATECSSQSTI